MARALIVGVVGVAAAAAALFDSGGPRTNPSPAQRPAATENDARFAGRTESGGPPRAEQLIIDRDQSITSGPGTGSVRDLFNANPPRRSPPPAAAPLAANEAPAFAVPDIEFLGRMSTGDANQAMVTSAGQSVLIKVGEAIEGLFTVRAIEDDYLTLAHTASGVEFKVARGAGRK